MRFRGAVVGLVVVGVLATSGASASAAPTTFQVLSATSTYTVSAERDCVSGHRKFTQALSGVVPDDPQNSYPLEDGFGSISTRSSITDESPTTGQFSEDYIDNECSDPPCHYDYGVTPVNGASIYMDITDIGNPEILKISTGFLPPGVGDVTNGICGGPIDVRFPYGEPSSTVSTDDLFSGKPVELIVAGTKTFDADNLGRAASVTVDYDVRMTVQSSGGSLQADPGGPYTV